MPEEIRLWQVTANDLLQECTPSSVNLESKLESWIENDIPVLDPDLLIIGRQVEAEPCGTIDLLAIDEAGDLVIVELKRDKTPREVTAQALDYASWVSDLSAEQVIEIAGKYLKKGLDEAFKDRFGIDLPESLNENHRMLIVGSEIDSRSERIINYLSVNHGVNINAASFRFFKSPSGSEFLARFFLIEPSELDSRTPSRSKRLPNLTYEQLEDLATRAGVGDLYRHSVQGLESYLQKQTTRSSVSFTANLEGSRKTVFNLIPRESNADQGLRYHAYSQRLSKLLNVSDDQIRDALPPSREPWTYYAGAPPDYAGWAGYFRTKEEVDRFLELIIKAKQG